MKNGVKSRIYYELLEWKDSNLRKFEQLYSGKRLCDLSVSELKQLHTLITNKEL